ncbi:oxalurate catabolism protein HpxZ [Acuticoccus mangrovi]|uniref:Oxalurate catabolism protein HpxZ n=1 Tax=Acuticoccus mangrovi TaxID=2796142 RepID=A0A934IJH8_9HYPH|nr:oxalurate catabolism protein HpxZ [Acuticoccus mangrovi]MBJ3777633.1 oxalurate catabolism protein HpxZ [Acuticoccus mangrovi]
MDRADINDPEIVKEVEAAFQGYEAALMANDLENLDAYFWQDPQVLRYGAGECLYGHEAIAAYRRTRKTIPQRTLRNTTIMTYGRDFATANTEFVREGNARLGRQTQTWVRMPEGWRIVAAHVSLMDEGVY